MHGRNSRSTITLFLFDGFSSQQTVHALTLAAFFLFSGFLLHVQTAETAVNN